MKIQSFEIKDFPPIKNLKIENLGNIVILAGANGSGKTRLKQAIVETFQGSPQMDITLESTRKEEEEKYFLGKKLEIKKGQNSSVLNNYISSRHSAGEYVGSLVQIDSERNIQTTKYNQLSWHVLDPDDQDTPNAFYYQKFTNRWQDFMNYIHQKVAAHQGKLAEEVQKQPQLKGVEILKKHPHPLEKYKQIFARLLPEKNLQDINPASPGEFHFKDLNGSILSFNSLSSGEQEVVKVIFDVVRKNIKHSVIIVDEPELHLHPTLTFKLIETLKDIGNHTNQYIFLTHSADLISTYYSTGDVYFIDAAQTGTNQAHRLSELNHSHKELVQLIGENLGLFAVGKKLVFVEGENASIDRLTYHAIAQKYLPEAKIIPVSSVENIITLNAFEEQIRKSIFGINLYMIRDRDGLTDSQVFEIEKGGRLKCLKRRHIENYFLDTDILYTVAERLCITATLPHLTKDFMEEKLKEIAEQSLNFNLLQSIKRYLSLNYHLEIPTVKAVDSKQLNEIKDEMKSAIQIVIGDLSSQLSQSNLEKWISEETIKLQGFLNGNEWKSHFHGKALFSKFCGDVLKEDPFRIRRAYIDIALDKKPEVFQEIIDIFSNFK